MDLVALNQAIFDEFHRITGVTNRFLFPVWYGAVTRHAIAALHDRPEAALAIWGRLTTAEQRDLLFRHLRAMPPARWPDIRLIVDNAYAAAGERAQRQAILDGPDRTSRVA